MLVGGFSERGQAGHLTPAGDRMSPPEQLPVPKAFLSVAGAFPTHRVRPIAAKPASTAVVTSLLDSRRVRGSAVIQSQGFEGIGRHRLALTAMRACASPWLRRSQRRRSSSNRMVAIKNGSSLVELRII